MYGWTPLHRASYNGAPEVGRLLLEYGANVEAKEHQDRTASQLAAEGGHYKVVELLREHGVK